jgi:glycosyltransferase involved in cell wall biosynthesis
MNKKILIKSRFDGWRTHSLYSEIVKYPPKNFAIEFEKIKKKNSNLYSIDNKNTHSLIKEIIFQLKPIPYLWTQKFQKIESKNYDLIYAAQHTLFDSSLPWITDLEFANALVAYGNISNVKNIIRKNLESRNCKYILPWSNWAKETLFNSIDCSKLKEKIKVVRYTVQPKNFKKIKHEKINFLFVGSSNEMNARNIKFKNLRETIKAFNNISKKYDLIHLTIRSKITNKIRDEIKNNPKITLLENYLTLDELYGLYKSADIFVLPSHETSGISLLDAMSFGLPVIALNIYDIPEVISNLKNGILINGHKNFPYYTKTRIPYDYSWKFSNAIEKYSDYLQKELEKTFIKLIEDSSLRNTLGQEAKKTIEKGELSITKRNKILSSIFESAMN